MMINNYRIAVSLVDIFFFCVIFYCTPFYSKRILLFLGYGRTLYSQTTRFLWNKIKVSPELILPQKLINPNEAKLFSGLLIYKIEQ